ncbi:solute carrier family 22 member 16-like [Aricia agestis]|uniref:solute carrier family 22 member 16-like n=1 Tax=Aricia agestis TaxID=91739 RepID=UPI001C202E76|nr:solute carrier family 22 member 16-like [Aricia agestis]
MDDQEEDFNLDAVLETLGPYGRYNLLNYVLVLFPVLLSSFFTCGFIFEAQSVDYRCEVEQCESNNVTDWIQYAIPTNRETNRLESCVRYVSNSSQCQREEFTNVTVKCSRFVYENRESMVKEFDLGCQEWKRVLVGTVHNFGMFVTMLFTGAISDRFGRRVAVGMAATTSFIFGISRAFSKDYITYVVLHFVEAALGGGLYQSGYVFAVELVSSKQRVAISAACSTTFVTGVVLLSLLAWAVDNWRTYIIVLYTPALIVTIYVWFMKESARWLISKGKTADAIKTLRGAAKINNMDHTKLELRALGNPLVKSEENEDKVERSEFSKAIRSSIIWKRLLMCSYLWLTCSLVYYGFSINAVSLSSNKYLSFILVALVEIPAYVVVVVVLNKYGRKRVMMVNYFVCAVTSFLFAFLPRCDYYSIPLYLVGKWCVTLTYSSVYIYVSEVFPTSMRQTLISFCSTAGKIGSLIAPLTPLLSLYHKSMPTVLFGSLCFVASCLTVLLPETRNTRLPDTIEEAEEISRNNGKSWL